MTTNIPARSLTKLIFLALILSSPYSLAAGPLVSAQTHGTAQQSDTRVTPAGLQYELPKGWKAENQENGSIFITFEEGACSVTFVFDDNYPDVVKGMKIGLKDQLTDIKFDGEAKEDTHNDMKHISESGTGLLKGVQGVKINWSIDVLKANKHVTMLTFGVEDVLKNHIDEYGKFIRSLKKTN